MASDKLLAAEIAGYINSSIPTIRDTHAKDPSFCIGYMWATLAHVLEMCGEPRPVAPWNEEQSHG